MYCIANINFHGSLSWLNITNILCKLNWIIEKIFRVNRILSFIYLAISKLTLTSNSVEIGEWCHQLVQVREKKTSAICSISLWIFLWHKKTFWALLLTLEYPLPNIKLLHLAVSVSTLWWPRSDVVGKLPAMISRWRGHSCQMLDWVFVARTNPLQQLVPELCTTLHCFLCCKPSLHKI